MSPDGLTVVFLRRPAEDMFRNSVYEIDVPTRKPSLLYGGPAKYEGRESSYFGRPEMDESRETLFLISKEYMQEGVLIAIRLATGQVRVISEHVVGYDVLTCPNYRGSLLVEKREHDILGRPYFPYWLYSAEGELLGLAGGVELDENLVRLGNCGDAPSGSAPPDFVRPADSHLNGAIQLGESAMARRLLSRREPTYPDRAKSEHIQGDVRLQVRVAPDGTVQAVNLVSGPPQLVQAAKAAVRQWRYQPVISSGTPVAVVTTATVQFRLPAPGK